MSKTLSAPFGTFYYRPAKADFRPTSLWRDLTPVDYFLARFNDNVFFQTAAWLVSRELSEAAGPWTDYDSPDDDGEYFCRVAMKSRTVQFVKDARTYYRVGNYGALNKARSERAQTALFGSKAKCIRYLLSLEDSPRTRRACVQLLDWLPDFIQAGRSRGRGRALATEPRWLRTRREVEVSAVGMAVRIWHSDEGREPTSQAPGRSCTQLGPIPVPQVSGSPRACLHIARWWRRRQVRNEP
jgi:hypothetical protein